MVMPGDNTSFEGNLITPIAMEKGLRFAIREGGKTIGAGTVAEIIEQIKKTLRIIVKAPYWSLYFLRIHKY